MLSDIKEKRLGRKAKTEQELKTEKFKGHMTSVLTESTVKGYKSKIIDASVTLEPQ